MSPAPRPQAWALADLPLHQLMTLGREIAKTDVMKDVRVAVLGDAATQHYCLTLSAALKLRGYWPDVFEAEYNTLHQEIRDADSALYAHRPDFVILLTATQAMWPRFAACRDKGVFADTIMDELGELWSEVRGRSSAIILQHNFVVPLNRPFGNNTATSPETFVHAITRLNALLAARAVKEGVRVVDTEFQAAYHGKRTWLDERLWCQARQALSPAFLPPLVKSVTDTLLLEIGVGTKCLVLDLDNTLWGGILADDGLEQIEIGHADVGLAFFRFQLALAELRARGVLLAACSKNDQQAVLQVLDDHPDMVLRRTDFALVVANLDDKVANIMRIREALDIGYDSMVFLDDTPFERDLVRTALPDVQVPDLPDDPASFVSRLAHWNLFEGRAPTSEDLLRTTYYQLDAARDEIRSKYCGLDEFIADLNMTAQVLPIDPYTLPRAVQLVQRSNQFNLTTIRHSEAALKALATSPDGAAFCISLSDRLGDNGIIALVVLRRNGTDAVVDTWIMSCRVLGRHVEELTIQQIVREAGRLGCTRIVGRYVPTSKNGMVAKLFPAQGFEDAGVEGEVRLYTLMVDHYRPPSIPIAVTRHERGH